eukprot:CAMPEP_0174258840 /NCGR_PEP_ID=MMETSP0439-20130205/7769_1 /TAXON_ID=0 /ORGANISM="Stereomyxa ramosa, Strain Chinc5" /LENGTH=1213 /DNA_ID=CAMNT_0015342505 /DNA_START=42 /DNA_END=3680 /DNA_ORIENTATION=+
MSDELLAVLRELVEDEQTLEVLGNDTFGVCLVLPFLLTVLTESSGEYPLLDVEEGVRIAGLSFGDEGELVLRGNKNIENGSVFEAEGPQPQQIMRYGGIVQILHNCSGVTTNPDENENENENEESGLKRKRENETGEEVEQSERKRSKKEEEEVEHTQDGDEQTEHFELQWDNGLLKTNITHSYKELTEDEVVACELLEKLYANFNRGPPSRFTFDKDLRRKALSILHSFFHRFRGARIPSGTKLHLMMCKFVSQNSQRILQSCKLHTVGPLISDCASKVPCTVDQLASLLSSDVSQQLIALKMLYILLAPQKYSRVCFSNKQSFKLKPALTEYFLRLPHSDSDDEDKRLLYVLKIYNVMFYGYGRRPFPPWQPTNTLPDSEWLASVVERMISIFVMPIEESDCDTKTVTNDEESVGLCLKWKIRKVIACILTSLSPYLKSHNLEKPILDTIYDCVRRDVLPRKVKAAFVKLLARYLDSLGDNLQQFLEEVLIPLCSWSKENELAWQDKAKSLEWLHMRQDRLGDIQVLLHALCETLEQHREAKTEFITALLPHLSDFKEKDSNELFGAITLSGLVVHSIVEETEPVIEVLKSEVLPNLSNCERYVAFAICELISGSSDTQPFATSEIMNQLVEFIKPCELPPLRFMAASSLSKIVQDQEGSATLLLSEGVEEVVDMVVEMFSEMPCDGLTSTLLALLQAHPQVAETKARTICSKIVETLTTQTKNDEAEYAVYEEIDGLSGIVWLLSPETCNDLCDIFVPFLLNVIENSTCTLSSCAEFLQHLTYKSCPICPELWTLFQPMCSLLMAHQHYFEDLLPALDNFISHGTETFLDSKEQHLETVMKLFMVCREEDMGSAKPLAELMESIVLNCSSRITHLIPKIIPKALKMISLFGMLQGASIINLICECLFVSPQITTSCEAFSSHCKSFIQVWSVLLHQRFLGTMPKHHSKVQILGISALFSLDMQSLPEYIQKEYVKIFSILLTLLPDKPKEKKERDEDNEDYGDQMIMNIDDEEAAHQSFLMMQNILMGKDVDINAPFIRHPHFNEPDDDDDDGGDVYFSILAQMDEVVFFVACVHSFSERCPDFYEPLLVALDPQQLEKLQFYLNQYQLSLVFKFPALFDKCCMTLRNENTTDNVSDNNQSKKENTEKETKEKEEPDKETKEKEERRKQSKGKEKEIEKEEPEKGEKQTKEKEKQREKQKEIEEATNAEW